MRLHDEISERGLGGECRNETPAQVDKKGQLPLELRSPSLSGAWRDEGACG